MTTALTDPDFFPDKDAHFMLSGPAGWIEVMTTTPKDAVQGVGIVCHPHPLQEGAMTNKVVHTTAKAFELKGLKTIRFNFRGVGQSQGTFADTVGETDDLMAVVNWAQKVLKKEPMWLAGFSFGAYVAANAATKVAVEQLITIAPGIPGYPFDKLDAINAPWLLILGTEDELVEVEPVEQWVQSQDKHNIDFQTIDQASHFFHGKLIDLRSLIEDRLQAI